MATLRASAPAQRRTVAAFIALLAAGLSVLGITPVPSAGAANPTLSFVAASSSSGNRATHTLTLPTGLQAGDTLVLFMTANSISGTISTPTGWALLQGKDGTATRGRAWTKQAVAGDAGSTVTVTTSATVKDTMSVAAYRSAGGTSSVTASAQTAGTASSTSHATPTVAVADAGSWLVNSWSVKSSTAQTWTKPATSTSRATPAATGSGLVGSLLADSGAAVPTGTAAARTATTTTAAGGEQLFSVVVSPGTGTPPVNRPPVPSFTVSCTGMLCSFDASGSTDPDNNPLTYAWNFGDAATGTGVTATHTYGTTGAKTVTLIVNDGTVSVPTTRTANPTSGATAATLSFVDSAAATSASSRTSHVVKLPSTVQAGDTLLLFLTVNSISGTVSTPTGWTQLQGKDGTATRGRAWTKQATSTDAGANVTVTTSASVKDAMRVVAYRSNGGTSWVTASALTAGTTSSTTHTSPSVAVAQANSWLVNAWAVKASATVAWTAPSGSTSRGTAASTGSGLVSSLVADSGAAVATGTAAGRAARTAAAAGGEQLFSVVVSPGTTTGPTSPGTLPVPGHTTLVPQTARTNTPLITDGEIFDMAQIGNRVFIAGTFTHIQNHTSTNTTTYNYAGLASYNIDTGLVDANFHPDFAGAEVDSVTATPDGTKLFVAGQFNTVNGVARKAIARLDPTTGAPVTAFTANADARASEVVASNTTLYAGGRFTKINNVARSSLAAVDTTTGQVDAGFVNDITHGVGVNGALTVQKLVLTHDMKKLLVVHTGLQVAGQDRAGVAIIDTTTKQLLPWHTTEWEDNLQFIGGIQRAYNAAISPDDSYFVVTSGSGGDRPPISDTAIRFPMNGGDNVQPDWVARCFDSVYSVAISEKAVYLGGHFSWNPSTSADSPWPGQADVGYGTGQGLGAYALGNQVVNRDHLGALDPTTGHALEWSPSSDSYEGNKAMLITSRGLFTGGDAVSQGGSKSGRVAFFDFNSVPAANGVSTTITDPVMGTVEDAGKQFTVDGTANATGGVSRVDLTIQDRTGGLYLQDDGSTWGAKNTINPTLGTPNAASTTWSFPVTVAGNIKMLATATAVSTTNVSDPNAPFKKFETFNLDDAPPNVTYSLPAAGVLNTESFTITGNATDDKGVTAVTMTIRNANNLYLQDDGTVATPYNAFRITPDVPGALSTTWSKQIVVPDEGLWKAQARAIDTGGQTSLDTTDRNWTVTLNGAAPVVSILTPSQVTPPTTPQPFTVTPGQPITFTGTATDDSNIVSIDVALLNNSTHEYLTNDGTFSVNNGLNLYRLMDHLNQKSVSWTYTTPFNLTPGSYTFAVLATDDSGISTPSTMWAIASFTAQLPADAFPKALLNTPGTQPPQSSLGIDISGTATDDKGVDHVLLSLRDADTATYLQSDGVSTSAKYAAISVPVSTQGGTNVTWSKHIDLPHQGAWNVTAVAVDTAGQTDLNNTNATATYLDYPGDLPPTFNMALFAPADGTAFPDGKIFVSGRAEDDQQIAKVEVQVKSLAGAYLTAAGAWSSNPTWLNVFLNSPGSLGSNFSYTSPIVPTGNYTISVRGTDQHHLVTTTPPSVNVSVVDPSDNPPVAVIDPPVCTNNVCQFDGRHSTDEDTPTLTYAWVFGDGTTSTGSNPLKTYTRAGTFPVTLQVKDKWGSLSNIATTTMTVVMPPGNVAPNPIINTPSCAGLTCNFSAVGTLDPNTGDTITYAWDFGDPTGVLNQRSGAASSHVFTASGTYTVTLTATDGWLNAKSITYTLNLP